MALMVSTRLWLGEVIRTRRDHALITCLVVMIAACAIVAGSGEEGSEQLYCGYASMS
jgi:hypothetical protein